MGLAASSSEWKAFKQPAGTSGLVVLCKSSRCLPLGGSTGSVMVVGTSIWSMVHLPGACSITLQTHMPHSTCISGCFSNDQLKAIGAAGSSLACALHNCHLNTLLTAGLEQSSTYPVWSSNEAPGHLRGAARARERKREGGSDCVWGGGGGEIVQRHCDLPITWMHALTRCLAHSIWLSCTVLQQAL